MSTATRNRPARPQASVTAFETFAKAADQYGFEAHSFDNDTHWQARCGRWTANFYRTGKIVLQGPMGFTKVVTGTSLDAVELLADLTDRKPAEQAPHPAPSGVSGDATGIGGGQPPEEHVAGMQAEQAQQRPDETLLEASVRTMDRDRVFVSTETKTMHLPKGEVLVPILFPASKDFLAGKAEGLRNAVELFKTFGPEAAEMIEGQLEMFGH